MPHALAPMRLRPFPSFVVSYTLNELGDWFGSIALAILVFDRTGSALATAALFMSAHFVPALASPALVARLERVAVVRSLPALYVAEALLFGLLALLVDHFSLPAVLALAFLDGAVAITGRALTRTATATVLERGGLLREGNGLMNLSLAVAAAVGPAAAGFTVQGFGVRTALLADAVLFLAMAVVVAVARDAPRARGDEGLGWREDLRAGLRHVRSHRPARALLGTQAAALVFFTLIVPVEVVYAKDVLHSGDAGYGALLAAWGAGVVAGALGFAAVPRRSTLALLAVSTAAIGVAYVGTALAGSLVLACAFAVVGGAGNGIESVAVVTAMQESVSAEFRGRALGLLESVNSAVPGVGFLVGGAVASFVSARAAYAVAGVGALLLVVALPAMGLGGLRAPSDQMEL